MGEILIEALFEIFHINWTRSESTRMMIDIWSTLALNIERYQPIEVAQTRGGKTVMVYNYKKQRSPIVPMYTIRGTSDGVPEKNGEDTRASKQQIRKIEDTPAPNSYSLPNMVGKTTQSNKRQAPCYSLTGRSKVGRFDEDLSKTPGPGTYITTDPNVFKNQAPYYSMTSRGYRWNGYYMYMESGFPFQRYVPGPGTYNTTDPNVFKDRAPHYSMTSRNVMPHNYTRKPEPGAHSP